MANYKLIGQRNLRLYTAAKASPTYAATVDAQLVVDSMCDVPWERAVAREATMTSHTDENVGTKESPISGLDQNVVIRDQFDAALFCAGHSGGQHRAYANAAVYHYALPEGSLPKLTKLSVQVTSDPYNSAGARIAVLTNSTGEIPTNCNVCRIGDAHADGVAPRTVAANGNWFPTTADCVFSADPAEGETALPSGGLQLQKHLFVFVLMESYSTVRGNWLEGCSFIRNLVSIETDAAVPGWTAGETIDLSRTDAREYNICRGGVLPAISGEITGLRTLTLQKTGDSLAANGELDGSSAFVESGRHDVRLNVSGTITSVDVMQPNMTSFGGNYVAVQFAVITGAFQQGTFSGLPGVLLYDMFHGRAITGVELSGFDGKLVSAAALGQLRGGSALAIQQTEAGKTTVAVWLYFNKGSIAKNGQVSHVVEFSYTQANGSVSGANLVQDAAYNADVDCHAGVQVGATQLRGFDRFEHVIIGESFITSANSPHAGMIPENGIRYEGSITSIRSMPWNGFDRMLVSGNLTSVNQVPCHNCAIVAINAEDGNASANAAPFDADITPDAYDHFSVSMQGSSIISASGDSNMIGSLDHNVYSLYFVTGRYNSLSGNSAYRKAIRIETDETDYGFYPLRINAQDVIGFAEIYGQSVDSNARLYGVGASAQNNVYSEPDLHPAVTDEQSCIGLRTLYAHLFTGSLHPIARQDLSSHDRVGAGFVIRTNVAAVNVLRPKGVYVVNIPVWQMTVAATAIPFAVPTDFHASAVRLDWSALVATGGKLNVWLKRNTFASELPDIGKPAFYTGESTAVEGFDLLGRIDASETTATFDIEPLTSRVATILITAYISLDTLNPSSSMIMPQGVCTGMAADPVYDVISGLSANWRPDITLIG